MAKDTKRNSKNMMDARIAAPKIRVDKKKDITLIEVSSNTFTDDEIKEIIALLSIENSEMKNKYFLYNTPIIEAKKRNFRQLLRIFGERCREHIYKNIVKKDIV